VGVQKKVGLFVSSGKRLTQILLGKQSLLFVSVCACGMSMSVFDDNTTALALSGAPTPLVRTTQDDGIADTTTHTAQFRLPAGAPQYVEGRPSYIYLVEFENWCQFNNIKLRDWLIVLQQCLVGSARAWMNCIMKEWSAVQAQITCRVFREAFLARFMGEDWQVQMRKVIGEFSFASVGSIQKFVTVWTQINAFVTDRTDADRMFSFMEKLPADAARFVRNARPKNTNEAVAAALRFEPPPALTVNDVLNVTNTPSAFPAGGSFAPPSLPPPIIPNVPPQYNVPPTSAGPMDVDMLLEHPKFINAMNNWSGRGRGGFRGGGGRDGRGGMGGRDGRGGKGGKGRGKCFNCEGTGHFARECPSPPRNNYSGGTGGAPNNFSGSSN
jgi:uncharacterized membrane protein YgcG